MRAIVLNKPGSPEQLKIEEREIPKVKTGWSLIKIKAFGLNHAESITRKGGSPTVKLPRVIGIECVGVIFDSTDEKLKVGKSVMTLMGGLGRVFDGSYEEYVLAPNNQIYSLPINASWEQLATIPESGYTAFGSIKNCKIKAGQSVLVRGATSTVGIAATQLLHAMGAKVTGTTRNSKKFQFIKDHGADKTVLDQDNKLQTGAKYDAIIEFVGEKTLADSLQHIKQPGGIVNVTGELADEWTNPNFTAFMIPSGSYLTSFQSTWVNRDWINEMLKLIEDNHLQFPIGKTLTFDQIVQAHRLLDSGQAHGKIVIKV